MNELLLAQIPDALLCLDRRLRITFANDEALRISRIDPSDLNSRSFWEKFPGTYESEIGRVVREVLETRTPAHLESFYEPLNHWIDLHVLPIEDGVALYYRDITLRKQAEQIRDASTSQLRQVLEATPDGILILDARWNFTFANQQAIHILNSGPLVGKNLWETYPHNRLEPFSSCYRKTMEERVPTEFEAYYPEPLRTWYGISSRPYDDQGIIIFFSDISARKLSEERRDESARLLEEVFEATADSIVCIGPDWLCTYANSRAHDLLKTDRLVGESLWTRFPENQKEPFASNYRMAMYERVSTEFEAHYPEPLGIWLHVTARPFKDGIIISSADISARKKAELLRDQTRSQLQQVFDAVTDGVIAVNREWTITFLNSSARRVVAPIGDLIGRDFWDALPEAGEIFHQNYSRTMLERVPTTFEAFYGGPLNGWYSVECRPSDDGIVIFFSDITERRNTEEAFRQQQALLANVQQAALIATWELDFASRRITFGSGSYPVFGRPLSEFSERDDVERLIPPQQREAVLESVRASLRARAPLFMEFQVLAEDGRLLWIENRGQIIYGEARPAGMRGISIDITARKQTEEARSASEERYRVLTDLNPQFIWMGAADGTITYANQRFLDYLGSTATADQTYWLGAFLPEERDRVMEVWTHSVETGVDFDIEARLVRASDGTARWFELRALPLHDETGSVARWLGVAIDIEESRSFAETLLRQQQETERQRVLLETIYRTAPIGLAVFDPVEFRYLRLNDRQAAFFGIPPEEIVGKAVTEMAPIAGLREMFEQVAAGNPVQNQLVQGELANHPGEHRYWTVNYFPVYASDGSIQAISAASLEVTQQKRAEEALIQSEKLAAVGRLASSISHEINNPLEAITNLLYLISTGEGLPDELKVYLHLAQSELARVSQIATQTLRFHRQAVRATHVTAAHLVEAVIGLYQGRLANSRIQVKATYSTETPILCFENDIRQVLNNLIANAIDAMRTGGRLLIRAHDGVDYPTGRRGVRITIADTGHGMSPETQRRLFEPFYTTKGMSGTGLGLWISSEIVERHQGRLTVRSSEHPAYHGTVFSLFLPYREG